MIMHSYADWPLQIHQHGSITKRRQLLKHTCTHNTEYSVTWLAEEQFLTHVSGTLRNNLTSLSSHKIQELVNYKAGWEGWDPSLKHTETTTIIFILYTCVAVMKLFSVTIENLHTKLLLQGPRDTDSCYSIWKSRQRNNNNLFVTAKPKTWSWMYYEFPMV